MAMVVVLFALADEAPTLRPAALEQLAGFGVTSVTLLRDGATVGFVLEGWAFDAERAADAARVFAGAGDDVRTLKPLMQMAVHAR